MWRGREEESRGGWLWGRREGHFQMASSVEELPLLRHGASSGSDGGDAREVGRTAMASRKYVAAGTLILFISVAAVLVVASRGDGGNTGFGSPPPVSSVEVAFSTEVAGPGSDRADIGKAENGTMQALGDGGGGGRAWGILLHA